MYRLDRENTSPDIDICYTMPRNFASRFRKNSKIKMAIYNYETDKLPKMWLDKIKHLDYVLPSSNFSKEVFVGSGWDESKCIVIPHGINPEDYEDKSKHNLYSQNTFKFLNVSIPHYRKNIDVLLDAYYSAFSGQDDVALILKTKLDLPSRKMFRFEVDVKKQIITMQRKHGRKAGGLPYVEVVQDRLPSMVPLYNACDAIVSASSSEGFGMPLLEGLAAGNIIIAPRCTGQLDFLNDQNSILIDVKEIDAGSKYQYWVPTEGAKTYRPVVDSLSQGMLNAFHNHKALMEEFSSERKRVVEEFTWENAAKKILEIK
jgi:glycosyltransferase involved in cell wall biosynthesis